MVIFKGQPQYQNKQVPKKLLSMEGPLFYPQYSHSASMLDTTLLCVVHISTYTTYDRHIWSQTDTNKIAHAFVTSRMEHPCYLP